MAYVKLARAVLAIGSLVAVVGCAGGGCGGVESTYVYPDAPPPPGEIHSEVITTRVQQTFLDFLTSHISDALRSLYPTRTFGGIERATIYLAEHGVDNAVATLTVRDGCIGEGNDPAVCAPSKVTKRSSIEFNLDTIDESFSARFVPGSTDAVEIEVRDLDLFLDIGAYTDNFLLAGGTCHIHDDEDDLPSISVKGLDFRVKLKVGNDGALTFELDNFVLDFGDFGDESVNISVDPCNTAACLDPECMPISNTSKCWGFANSCTWMWGLVESGEFLTTLLGPLLESALPALMENLLAAILDATDPVMLRFEQQIDLASALEAEGRIDATGGVFDATTPLNLGILPNSDVFRATGAGQARGMSALLDAGAFADSQSVCVPSVSLPDFDANFASAPPLTGSVEVGGVLESYDFAVLISEVFTRQIGYAAHQMGALCLSLPSTSLGSFSDGALTLETLALIAPELGEIGDPGSPLIFQLHPTRAPDVYFGTGVPIDTEADGAPALDSMVSLDIGELGLSIFAQVEGDYRRLATISGDAFVGLRIGRTDSNTIALDIERIRFAHVEEIYNELGPDADFAEVIEVLVDLALETVLSGFSTFEFDLASTVSAGLGIPVSARFNDIRRVGDDSGHLAIFVRLCDAQDLADPSAGPCYTPNVGSHFSNEATWVGGGRRRLARAGQNGGFTPVEVETSPSVDVRFRVDGGAWWSSRADEDGIAHLDTPRLRIPGYHRVDISVLGPTGRFGPAQFLDIFVR